VRKAGGARSRAPSGQAQEHPGGAGAARRRAGASAVRAAPSGGRLRLGVAQAGVAQAWAGLAARRARARARHRRTAGAGTLARDAPERGAWAVQTCSKRVRALERQHRRGQAQAVGTAMT
jgi:hypothetical protein